MLVRQGLVLGALPPVRMGLCLARVPSSLSRQMRIALRWACRCARYCWNPTLSWRCSTLSCPCVESMGAWSEQREAVLFGLMD